MEKSSQLSYAVQLESRLIQQADQIAFLQRQCSRVGSPSKSAYFVKLDDAYAPEVHQRTPHASKIAARTHSPSRRHASPTRTVKVGSGARLSVSEERPSIFSTERSVFEKDNRHANFSLAPSNSAKPSNLLSGKICWHTMSP